MPPAKINTPDNYVFGRPSIYDLKKWADDIDEWSKSPDATSVRKWYIEREIDPVLPSRWAKSNEYFGQKYRIALMRIAQRREDMLNADEMQFPVYNRHQFFYEAAEKASQNDDEEKAHKRKKDLMKYEAKLKAQAAVNASPNDNQLDQIIDTLKATNATIPETNPKLSTSE